MKDTEERGAWVPERSVYGEKMFTEVETREKLWLSDLEVGDKVTLIFGRLSGGYRIEDAEMTVIEAGLHPKVILTGGPGEWTEERECEVIGALLFSGSSTVVRGAIVKGMGAELTYYDDELKAQQLANEVPLFVSAEGEAYYQEFVEMAGEEVAAKSFAGRLGLMMIRFPVVKEFRVEKFKAGE